MRSKKRKIWQRCVIFRNRKKKVQSGGGGGGWYGNRRIRVEWGGLRLKITGSVKFVTTTRENQ